MPIGSLALIVLRTLINEPGYIFEQVFVVAGAKKALFAQWIRYPCDFDCHHIRRVPGWDVTVGFFLAP
ncbi:MAG: hypothetical protein OXF02_00830 [Simkaniaceae bacterium]|nr:hypothetical protein [Simkaniaceae bacterium]